MSVTIKSYPSGQKLEITAVYNNDGDSQLEVVANDSVYPVVVGQEISVFTAVFNGKYLISEIETSATGIILVTIVCTYVSTSTGYLLTDITIPTTSYWNASKNTPLKWEFQRQDIIPYKVTAYLDHIIILSYGDFTSYIDNGDYVYFKGYNAGVAIYDNTFLVIQRSSIGGVTYLEVDTPYIANIDNGFVNSNGYKENYYLNITLSSDNWDDKVIKAYPDKAGGIYADIHDRLQSELNLQDDFDFEDINIRDFNIAGWYNISYEEVWLTSSGTETQLPNRYYYSFAEKLLLQYSNQFNHLVKNEGERPLGKFLNNGVPKVYVQDGIVQFPFDFSILTSVGILKKIEVTYDESKAVVSTDEYILDNAANALNRIILSNSYDEDDIKYIEVFLSVSLFGIKQLYTTNPANGVIYDEYGASNGQLKEANCILATTDTEIVFLGEIDFDWTSLSYSGTAIISGAGNTITVSQGGTIYDLWVLDSVVGDDYFFSCAEVWENVTKQNYIMHGERSGGTIIYAFVSDCSFTTQDAKFYFQQNGADKNINQSDSSQIIYTPKDANKGSMYVVGTDDEKYISDLGAITD